MRHLWLVAAAVFFVVGIFSARSLYSDRGSEDLSTSTPREAANSPAEYAQMTPAPTPDPTPEPTLEVSLLDESVSYGEYQLPQWKDTYKVTLPKGGWYDTGIPVIANYVVEIRDYGEKMKWESRLNDTVYIAEQGYGGNYQSHINHLEEGEHVSPLFLETLKLRYPIGDALYIRLKVTVSFNREPHCGGWFYGDKTPECNKRRNTRKEMQKKLVALRNKIPGSELWR